MGWHLYVTFKSIAHSGALMMAPAEHKLKKEQLNELNGAKVKRAQSSSSDFGVTETNL